MGANRCYLYNLQDMGITYKYLNCVKCGKSFKISLDYLKEHNQDPLGYACKDCIFFFLDVNMHGLRWYDANYIKRYPDAYSKEEYIKRLLVEIL